MGYQNFLPNVLFLFERLICQNPDSKVTLTNDLGVSADYVEGAAFAYLPCAFGVLFLKITICKH
jgi:1,6-anhydro-N-acetylmuramate kinase